VKDAQIEALEARLAVLEGALQAEERPSVSFADLAKKSNVVER